MAGQWDNNNGLVVNTLVANTYTQGTTPLTATFAALNSVGTIGTVRVPLTSGKNAAGTALVATSPGSTDFVVVSTVGTILNLAGHAAQNNTKADNVVYELVIPKSYTAATDLTLTVQSSYTLAAGTTITATVDAVFYKMATDGTNGSDLCATAAQAITASKVDYAFTITGATLTPGDRVLFQITTSVQEAGNTGTATGKVWSVRLS